MNNEKQRAFQRSDPRGISRFIGYVLASFSIVLLGGQKDGNTTSTPSIPLTYAQITALLPVTKYSGNPLIVSKQSGSNQAWFWSQIYDAQVLVNPSDNTQLIMYTSGMHAPLATGVQSIGRWTASANNIYFWSQVGVKNPVFGPNASYWDNTTSGTGNRLGSVIYVKGAFYMYYTGGRLGSHPAIGLATSTDGIKFARTGNSGSNLGLVLQPTVDEQGLEDPSVLYDNGTWYMVYAYRRKGGYDSYTRGVTLPAFRVATSDDGINWTKVGGNGSVAGTDVLSHGGLNTWDGYHIEWHQVYKIADGYLMIYEAIGAKPDGTNNVTGNTGFAFSSSMTGVFTKYSRNPVIMAADYNPSNNTINTGLPYTWDFTDAVTPSLFYHKGQLLLFYCGGNNYTGNSSDYNYNHYDIGVAALSGKSVGNIPQRSTGRKAGDLK